MTKHWLSGVALAAALAFSGAASAQTADSDARRLYVSHDREVVVLDLDSGAIIGKIPGSDVHGIAVAKEFGRGFISASDPGSVTIFDLKTLAVIGKVTVGADPNGNAFRNCWTTHRLIGCFVTLKCRIRRRSWLMTKKQ